MNSSTFKEISEMLNIKDVAGYLGLQVNRAGFINCPLHNERTASCKLYDHRFWCFGCQTGGDSIDLMAAVKDISKAEAAAELNSYFQLGVDLGTRVKKIRRKPKETQTDAEQLKQMVNHVADFHRFLLHQFGRCDALEGNIEDFHQRLLDDDDLRISAPRDFYERYKDEFIYYGNAERRYYAVRDIIERSRRNGQPYSWDEVLAVMGRSRTAAG